MNRPKKKCHIILNIKYRFRCDAPRSLKSGGTLTCSRKGTCEYDWICSFCEDDYKNCLDDTGCPICCNKAKDEWEAEQAKIKEASND